MPVSGIERTILTIMETLPHYKQHAAIMEQLKIGALIYFRHMGTLVTKGYCTYLGTTVFVRTTKPIPSEGD